MSLYAVLGYNEVFSRAACLSPSVWFAAKQLDSFIAGASVSPDTVVYIDYGARELSHHKNMEMRFRKVANLLYDKKIDINARIVPLGDHCEACWERQIPIFMNVLCYEV